MLQGLTFSSKLPLHFRLFSLKSRADSEAFTSLSFTLRPFHIHSSVFQEALLPSCSSTTLPLVEVPWKTTEQRERESNDQTATGARREGDKLLHSLQDTKPLCVLCTILASFLELTCLNKVRIGSSLRVEFGQLKTVGAKKQLGSRCQRLR